MPENQNGQGKLAELLSGLLPTTRWGWLMLAGGLVWFVNWVFSVDGEIFGSAALKTFIDLLSLLACIPLFYFLYRGSHWVVEHLLWRLRRRLIVTYLLIGVLPLVLVLVLVALSGFLVIMQSGSSLVGRQLDGYLEQSQSAAHALSRDLNREESLRLAPAELRAQLQERANALAPIFPEVTLAILHGGESSSSLSVMAAPTEAGKGRPQQQSSPPDLSNLPRWLGEREQFHGLVVTEVGGRRQVRAHHFIRSMTPRPWIFQLTYPIGPELAEHLTRTTDLVVRPGQAKIPFIRTPAGELILDNRQLTDIGQQAGNSALDPGYPIITSIIDWKTGTQMESEALEVDPSFLWPGQIWRRVQQFRRGGGFGEIVINMISALAVIFLLITLVAIVSAIFLTRSITGAVHYLYQGTRRIEAGDFDHEIPIRGRDQLSSLGISFNQMTQSVRKLLRVSAEKERLDQEMKIAAEVQARLFPRAVPSTQTLDVAPGICIPARAVSGDYYDFLDIAPGVLGVVVADVCGKGVSAALMMANLQANLRGQVLAYRDAYQDRLERVASVEGGEAMSMSGLPDGRVKRIVERANRQITGSMMDANYVTLFYAEFDEQAGTLHYTNAGHNPPLLLRGSRKDKKGQPEVERLDRGGTVIGLFQDVEYEDGELLLESGDLLVAFTDGLIEARSPQGQEFGEERLIRLLAKSTHLSSADLEKMILKTVKSWTANAEQEDDLTLVIVKRR
jgi:sigma-B regulation protein RsbU (phosphoserine phosphatase)